MNISDDLLYDALNTLDLKTVDALLPIMYTPVSIEIQEKYIDALCKLNRIDDIDNFLNTNTCIRVVPCYECEIGTKWPCCKQNKYKILMLIAAKIGNIQLLDYMLSRGYHFTEFKSLDYSYLTNFMKHKHPEFIVWLYQRFSTAYSYSINEQLVLLDYGYNKHVTNPISKQIYKKLSQYRRHKAELFIDSIKITDWDYKYLTNIVCDYIADKNGQYG